MIKLGLIGYPLAHSISPAIQGAALKATGLEGDYALYETQDLKAIVEFFKSNDFKGFNVTIPHKIAIMEYLDNIDDFARKVGAVNTVVIDDNKQLSGHNTDVYGFITAIPEDIRQSLKGKSAAIIGSGGAARAVTAGMAEIGIVDIETITLESEISKVKGKCSILNEKVNLSEYSLVVNATPVGMEGKFEGMSPLSEYSINSIPKSTLVYDIVYKPKKTKLLELAEKRGLRTLNGLDMLVLQGAKAFSLWTGLEAPIEAMRSACPC